MTAARNVFDATREVGARAPASAPARLSYRCAADGCPMPGVITPEGSSQGLCGWHYGEQPGRWPAITGILAGDWVCVTMRYLAARRLLCDAARCMTHEGHEDLLREAAALAFEAPDWGLEPAPGEDVGGWSWRLAAFLHSAARGKPQTPPRRSVSGRVEPQRPRQSVPRETESALTGRTPSAVFLDEIDRFYSEERAQ